jgi:hypothetical protein
MARAENFYLDTRGGALILQQTVKNTVHGSAQRIAQAAMSMSGSSSGRKASLKVVGSIEPLGGRAGSERYVATVIAADTQSEIQLRRGNYVAKARNAGRV